MKRGLTISSAAPLSKHTTIRLGGTPIARVVVDDVCGFESLPAELDSLGGSPAVLGRGSNILARGGDLPLVLVELGKAFAGAKPTLLREDDGSATVYAGAAMPLALFISRLTGMGLGGLTGLAGIPGQIGGAIAQNAGSFGDEIKSCLSSVNLFSPELGRVTLTASELDIDYRHFGLPQLASLGNSPRNWFIIEGAEFCLRKAPVAELQARTRKCLTRKAQSQPVAAASAGCIFKNHEAGPAGMLLEKSGMKGQAQGGMSFSTIHANFMVNNSSGTPEQAFALIDEARSAVLERFGAQLELEVKVWPF